MLKSSEISHMVLLSVLRKTQRKTRQARVLLLGLDNSGKSSIVARILNEDLDSVQPTLGFQIRTINLRGVNLNIWDVGGQKSLRPFWHNYFESTDFLIWVVDGADLDRLESCKLMLSEVLHLDDKFEHCGVLIFINKSDCFSDLSLEFVEQKLDLHLYSQDHKYKLVKCSAKTGEGINEGLEFIADELKQRLFLNFN